MPGRKVLVSDVRVRGIGKSEIESSPVLESAKTPAKPEKVKLIAMQF